MHDVELWRQGDPDLWRQRASIYRALGDLATEQKLRSGWQRLADICDELADDLSAIEMFPDLAVLH